jgi:Bacterial PH domain/Short C-terminal domain
MSLSDNLIPNESVLFESEKHWVAPIRASLVAIGLILLAGLLGIIKPSGDGIFGWIGSVLGLIQSGLVIAGGVWIAYNIVLWRTAQFAVTNLRVLRYEGLVRRRTSETLLSSVTDVRVVVGLLGRQLGYGDIRIVTGAGEAAADSFTSITKPLEFRNAMMARRMAAEGSVDAAAPVASSRGRAAPPVPAPAGVSASGLDPAGAAGTADAAAAIRQLGELRDQGLISDAEFDAKKRELLARI